MLYLVVPRVEIKRIIGTKHVRKNKIEIIVTFCVGEDGAEYDGLDCGLADETLRVGLLSGNCIGGGRPSAGYSPTPLAANDSSMRPAEEKTDRLKRFSALDLSCACYMSTTAGKRDNTIRPNTGKYIVCVCTGAQQKKNPRRECDIYIINALVILCDGRT